MRRICMKKIVTLVATVVVLCQLSAFAGPTTALTKMDSNEFKTKMRELWNDHGVWTREYIVSALADSPATEAASKRLLRNQEDIGNGVAPFYGKDAGKALTDLLKDHILIAVDIVTAAKKGDKKGAAFYTKQWECNARDLSKFLSKANPYITEDAMFTMLKEHLSITGNEVPLRLNKQWNKEVVNYDKVREQLNHMADALSQAIIKQFPKRFK